MRISLSFDISKTDKCICHWSSPSLRTGCYADCSRAWNQKDKL